MALQLKVCRDRPQLSLMDNTYPITSNNFQFTHLRCCIPAGTCTKVASLCAAAEIWRKSGKSEKFTEDQKHMYFFCCRNNLTVCFKIHTKVSNISSDKFILINYNDQSFTTGLWVL